MKMPRITDDVLGLGEDISDGLKRHGTDLGSTMATEPIVRNAIITAEAAIRGYEESFAAKSLAYAAQAEADEQGRKFIRAARNVIALQYGEFYSPAWKPTGFPDNTTAIPLTILGRQTLLRALQTFFANHSVFEAPALGITAAQAGVCFNNVSDKRSAVNVALEETNVNKIVRDAAVDELRRIIGVCIFELRQLMADDDPRWYAFGLTPPAVTESPEMVEQLVLSNAGPGLVLASWTNATRATRYRLFKQIMGVDAEPVPLDPVSDTQFAFTGLTSGQTLKVYVVAGNDVGVSDPSETMEIVVA
jgi:hypothetical protein